MAFAPYKHRLARAAALSYAEATLDAFLDGRERAYAVHDVIAEIEALFGAAGVLPIKAIRLALASPYEEGARGLAAPSGGAPLRHACP